MAALALTAAGPLIASASAATCSGKCFTASFSPATTFAGQVTPFSVLLTNNSAPGLGQQVGSVNITAPAGFSSIAITQPLLGSATLAGNVIQLRNINIPTAGGTLTYKFTATAPTATGVYTWGVAAKQSNDFNGTGNDVTLDTAHSALTTTVGSPPANADVAVAFGAGATPPDQPDPVGSGNSVLYTLSVTNHGPQASTISLTDTLTGNGTITSIPAAGSGSGWTCHLSSSTVATCSYPALASGQSASTLQLWASASSGAITPVSCGGSTVSGLCDTASVSGSVSDSNTANNTASEATVVQPAGTCAAATNVSCGTGFIDYSKPSAVTTGSSTTPAAWLVGTESFAATTATGGTLFAMNAPAVPSTDCPGLNGTLLQCTFEMRTDKVPAPYTANNTTLHLICDSTHCAGALASSLLMFHANDDDSNITSIPSCNAPTTAAGALCFTATNSGGNLDVIVRNIKPGDPKYLGLIG